MKHFVLLALATLLLSCAGPAHQARKIASEAKDLTGNYLGVAVYPSGHKGPNKPAIRIYFHPIENKPGMYDVVLLEYVDLLKMAPSYIVSNKIPFIAKKVGFLNSISKNISTYEASPGQKEGTWELWPLSVVGEQIIAKKQGTPRLLTLSPDENLTHPLEGATISSSKPSEPKEIFFPKKDDKKRNGIQYGTAKLAYKAAKLESTWRKEYLRGPYLSQYYKKNDVVLNLGKSEDKDIAQFVINEAMAKVSENKRKKVFTNPKSAFLKGDFSVSEPRDGMFLFHTINADATTQEVVTSRIGLFIDVFDATKSLNQDVVELALVDAQNPEDFLMYYEHPENGEGTKKED